MITSENATSSSKSEPWHGALEFRTLAETIPCLVFVTDAMGENIYTNVQFQRYTGVSADSLLGQGWLEFVHDDDRIHARQSWDQSTIGDAPYDIRFRLRRYDGAYRMHVVRGSPVPVPFGTPNRWIGSCTDVHDLMRSPVLADSANQHVSFPPLPLAASEPIQQIIDALPLIVWQADHLGKITGVNAAWWAACGGPMTDHPEFEDLLSPEALGDFQAQWRYATETGELIDVDTVIADRIEGAIAMRAIAIPTWDSTLGASRPQWVGSFCRAPYEITDRSIPCVPQPISEALCCDDRASVLVYLKDSQSDDWGEPEVAHWLDGEWHVAGQPVKWPTHYLPLPKLGTAEARHGASSAVVALHATRQQP